MIIMLSFSLKVFPQKSGNKKIYKENPDKICKDHFLRQQISHSKYFSQTIFLPIRVYGDKYRMMIKSEYLHRFLTNRMAKTETEFKKDSILLDSIIYLNTVMKIINGKEKLDFNVSAFDMFVKDGKYNILDKANPYTKEIKQYGLGRFVKKRLVELGKRGNNILYRIIANNEYGRLNEYNYFYLIEALFEYNFIYESGDGMEGFTKVSCPIF